MAREGSSRASFRSRRSSECLPILALWIVPTIKGTLFGGNQPLTPGLLSNDILTPDHDGMPVSPPNVRHEYVQALLDTGATVTCIDKALCSRLALQHYGATQVLGIDSSKYVLRGKFIAKFEFIHGAEGSEERIELPDYVNAAIVDLRDRNYSVVLGMDVLGIGDFCIHRDRTFSFEFSANSPSDSG